MTISVIMPVYLGDYEGAAKNREEKFIRAVNSFFLQGQPGAELIVVSDGCEIANAIYEREYDPPVHCAGEEGMSMRLIRMEKQSLFSGAVRNAGIAEAKGDIICYLDSDDMFLPGHLAAIHAAFNLPAGQEWLYRRWVYFNDFVAGPPAEEGGDPSVLRERYTSLRYAGIGAGSFAHERGLDILWGDGYGHDWRFIDQLMARYPHTRQVFGPRYLVCHLPPDTDY